MSHQQRIWSANFESISLWVTALKYVDIRPEVEGSGPLNTQPSGKRTVIGVLFGRFENNPIGGYNGTHPDQGPLLHLRNCTSSEELALNADKRLLMIRHQILRLQYLILPSHTAWPQETGKSHPNKPVSTSTRQFARQWF